MRSIAAAMLFVIGALPAFAQRYDDAVTVNVVDVPVYVERFGVPITGLTREDFELFVNGKPHPIEYFDVVDQRARENAPAAANAPVELKRRRLIVLLFDVAAPPWSLQRARKAAAKYVDEGASGDTFAVATVGYSGVLFIVPFTTDLIAVQRAIATLRPSAARDPFRVATLDVERSRGDIGGAGAGRGVFGGIWGGHPGDQLPGSFEPPAIAGWYTGAAIDMDGAQNDFASRGLIDNLNTLADRLAPLEGLKEVVLLSEGKGDPDAAFSWSGRLAAYVRLHKRFRAAGVILNAVDISTARAPGGGAFNRVSMGSRGPNLLASSFLWALALDTGGIATTSLPNLQERHRLSYVIGFRPPASGSKNNSIHVRVRNQPILTDVRYRKSYSLDREPTDDGLFLADTLLNDIAQNGVTVDLSVHGKLNGAWVVASIPGVELLSYAPEHRLSLDVYFYVFDEQQRPVAWNRMQIAVDLEKGREFLSTNPYTMRQEFVLEPGRYVAKALVRIAGTDRMGFRRTEFEVQP